MCNQQVLPRDVRWEAGTQAHRKGMQLPKTPPIAHNNPKQVISRYAYGPETIITCNRRRGAAPVCYNVKTTPEFFVILNTHALKPLHAHRPHPIRLAPLPKPTTCLFVSLTSSSHPQPSSTTFLYPTFFNHHPITNTRQKRDSSSFAKRGKVVKRQADKDDKEKAQRLRPSRLDSKAIDEPKRDIARNEASICPAAAISFPEGIEV